ncbi:MAG: tRNA uridine(34) 5-carboxymethylaminomethyl modification radical SAM/GNAT enzyme Elp3 [Anaerolineaceae bacterium]|nr:MAG: tRNA uridine(34) 5-carboxymethylaminomethyl modification radical SAM/GNAT enzyme Elp3 [Anaerolineaceae bacterium]
MYNNFDLQAERQPILAILREVIDAPQKLPVAAFDKLVRRHPRPAGGLFSRSDLISAYRQMAGTHGLPPFDPVIVERLRRKPIRTSSGVTPVTVLTKPFPCPGECIFCPNDVRMPKSYLSDEPGAQRAEQNGFDPYLQTYTRLQAYYNLGHPTEKIEIIVLGGTWSFYPETYQIWFIKRIFDALHDFGDGVDNRPQVEAALAVGSQLHPQNNITNVTVYGVDMGRSYNQVVQDIYRDEMTRSKGVARAIDGGHQRSPIDEFATWEELEEAHRRNESAPCRAVGLVVETRPDHIDTAEVLRARRLGCTKVQIGFQSLNDDVLAINKRGHDVAATRRAVTLLRKAGFKIHAHWMPNLYGSSPQMDIADYRKMFDDPDFRPDELKVYPCSLIESAELMQRYQDGSWRPYDEDELLDVLTACFMYTPEYCRLTRVIRDIPGTDIVVGNQKTNFRQIVENRLAERGQRSPDIRAREIRQRRVTMDDLTLDVIHYTANSADEVFLQFITAERDIAGFLRLSLPHADAAPLTAELTGCAMIREVHVYGQAVDIGASVPGRAQHLGLGSQLIDHAARIAAERGYKRLAVISSVGTREYYRGRGFTDGALYQIRAL